MSNVDDRVNLLFDRTAQLAVEYVQLRLAVERACNEIEDWRIEKLRGGGGKTLEQCIAELRSLVTR